MIQPADNIITAYPVKPGTYNAEHFLVPSPVASPSTLTSDIFAYFEDNPDAVVMPVVDEKSGRPTGLINRNILMSSLARPYYKEIYMDKSCMVFMDKQPLIIETHVSLTELSLLVSQGGSKVLSDGFIITARGRYCGIGQTQAVLHTMANVHETNARSLARHQDRLEEIIIERTAQLIKAKEAAEEASKAKSAFLANMSHEIRTPMHAIISMTHLIMRDGATPAQADRLEKIDHAARHLLSIINDILDISRIEAGKFTLEENVINLAHIASTVVTMLSDSAQAKGLRLIVDMEPGNVTYLGDRTRLTQAILNYVSNAIKFTDQGCITLRMRKLEEQDLKVLMHFEVRDTGKGIKPEALGKLFQPFEQGDNSLTREHGGTGLGLAITRRLAQFMGGTTGATSTPGAGSNFWLTAWLDKQTEPRQSDASPLQEDAEDYLNQHYKGCRVLVVDDDPINREVTKTLLGDIPFQVDLASDGEAAIAMAGRGNYDVILMDMQMPNLDGLGATRRIRALPDGGRVPIIAMTANAYADDRERCFESGMNDILIKPCEPADLFAMLLRWLPATSETRKLPH